MGKPVGEILKIIQPNPKITLPQLACLTGLTQRGIEWNISKLKADGFLGRIGPNKGGYWEINR